MAEFQELKATARTRTSKGSASAIRRAGRVPGIIYGETEPPEMISLDYRELLQQVHTGIFLSTVYIVDLDGTKTRVIPRELQVDPVRDFPIHVDLLRLGEDATIAVEVPVHFYNEEESPGLKRGGVLNIVRHTIELNCPADAIPENIEVDLTGLEIGDSVHVSEISLPEEVEVTVTDRDFTVATIVGRMAEIVEEVEEVESLEGEEIEGEEGEEGEGVEGEGEGEEETEAAKEE